MNFKLLQTQRVLLSVMNRNFPYSTPEGYFKDLSERLCEIPSQHAHTPFRVVVRPYLAMAACLAVVIICGTLFLKTTAEEPGSDDELIEYLIDSGTTLAQIESIFDENE